MYQWNKNPLKDNSLQCFLLWTTTLSEEI
uniref:Uncharacterized protein n=1 Tax=Arundo donax TaxID=35708 RepID=A0A0A9GAZ6_ARUDO